MVESKVYENGFCEIYILTYICLGRPISFCEVENTVESSVHKNGFCEILISTVKLLDIGYHFAF